MEALKAETTLTNLRQNFPSATFTMRGTGGSVEIIGVAKQLDVNSDGLTRLAKIVKDNTVSFGRTGANFRMIIK